MAQCLLGAIALGSALAALIFLRFWRKIAYGLILAAIWSKNRPRR